MKNNAISGPVYPRHYVRLTPFIIFIQAVNFIVTHVTKGNQVFDAIFSLFGMGFNMV